MASSSSSGCGNPYDPNRYILPKDDVTPQTDIYYLCGDSSSSSSSCLGADYCVSCLGSAEYPPDDPRGKEPPQPIGCYYPVIKCDTLEILYNIPCDEDGIDTATLYNLYYKVGDDCLEVNGAVTLFPSAAAPIDLGLVPAADVFNDCGCTDPTYPPPDTCPSVSFTGCDDGSNCTHCDDINPLVYTVTFSGVNLCPCTEISSWFYTTTWLGGDVLNDTFELTQTSGCTWEYTTPTDVMNVNIHTIACGNPTGDHLDRNDSMTIKLERTATEWILTVTNTAIDTYLFRDVQLADDDGTSLCATVPKFANDFGCGDVSYQATGDGGTACVNAGPCNPCYSCDPSGAGTAPESAVVSGHTSPCDTYNGTYAYANAIASNGYRCGWRWEGSSNVVIVYYWYADETADLGCGLVNYSAGEWAIVHSRFGTYTFIEKTTGFTCDDVTGKVYGTHAFVSGQCAGGGGCVDSPTITVDP